MSGVAWTWDECLDQLTMPRIEAIYRAWKRTPPTAKLLAAFVGYKPPPDAGEASPGVQHMTGDMMDAIIRAGGVLISADMLNGGAR